MYLLLLGCRYGHEKAVLFTTKRAAEAEYNLLPNYATDKHEWDKENSQIMEIHYEV